VIAAYDALVVKHRDMSESLQRETRQRALEEQRNMLAAKLQSGAAKYRQSLIDISGNLSREVNSMSDVSGQLGDAAAGILGGMSAIQAQSEKNFERALRAQELKSGLQDVVRDIESHAMKTNMAGDAVNAAGSTMHERLEELA